jgi:hypothetical protein
MRDIYDSTPTTVSVNLPASEPLHLTGTDFAFLLVSSLTVLILSLGGWLLDGTVSLFIALGGSLVVFESWHTALMFLHRHHQEDRQSRIFIHLAALIPWVVVLGSAALAMLGLFWISDNWFS